MFKTLLKKQFTEIFRAYFFDQKKNKARTHGQTVGLFILFGFLMILIFGSVMLPICMMLCPALAATGNAWLYYAIIGLLALVLGVFGSVFTTYTTLYVAKDNDLLLSMPIPVRYIMFSRLLSVYLMGLIYCAMPVIGAGVIYFIFTGVTVKAVIGCVMLLLIVSLIVFILACGLGYVVAGISRKLKNKSVFVVLLSLAGFALYYVLYFKAMNGIEEIVANAALYGQQVKDSAYILYLFGSVGVGEAVPILIFTASVLAVLALVWYIISRSFIKIATSTSTASKARVRLKDSEAKSVGAALIGKEFARFIASPLYMLNSGLGVLFIPAVGVFFLIKGREIAQTLSAAFGGSAFIAIAVYGITLFLLMMISPAIASFSLEGKNIWIPRSLPIEPIRIIKAKLSLQLLLSGVPAVFTAICAVASFGFSVFDSVMLFSAMISAVLLGSVFYTFLGIRFANLTWTNEMIPIKQGTGVLVGMLSTLGFTIVSGGVCSVLCLFAGAGVSLAVVTAVSLGISALIYRWLKTKGCEMFERLQ